MFLYIMDNFNREDNKKIRGMSQEKQGIMVKEKNPGIAAVLSFVYPGLGQVYNEEIKKGIIFIVIGIILLLSMALFVGFILYPIFWGYNVFDAYKTAKATQK